MGDKTIRVIMAEFTDVRFDARVLKCARALAQAGYQVDLLMYNESIKQNRRRVEGNLTYNEYAFPERSQTQSIFARCRRLWRAGLLIGRISMWILSHRADIYHAHNLYFLWSSVLASKYFKAKVIYDAHELHSEHYHGGKGRIRNMINEVYERALLPHCTVFIQASSERAEYISRKYGIPKPHVINNYVPTVEYTGPTDRIRLECNLPLDAVILFYSGGLYSGGGRQIDKIIATLPQLPNTHLVIVGFMNDDIRERLLDDARDYSVFEQVHLLPPCSPHEIFDYATSADIGVIPLYGNSLNTKMSALNKISEYLMAGLPIVCSSYPNLDSLMRDNPIGPVGETFDVSSPDSIAGAIRSILTRREKDNFRENALRLADSLLNWELEEQKLLSIYKTVCG